MKAAIAAVVVVACNDPADPGITSRTPPASGSATDAGAPSIDAAAVADRKLAMATAYVEKLANVPAIVKAAKRPPSACSGSAAADRTAAVLGLDTLKAMAGIAVDYRIDPTFFMLDLEPQGVGELSDVRRHARGALEDPPHLTTWADAAMHPLAIVVRVDRLDVPQLDEGKHFWAGELHGFAFVVDISAGQVLCGAALTFASAKQVKVWQSGIKDTSRGTTIYLSNDDPKASLKKDFAERGRAALRATIKKIAPELEVLTRT